MIAIPKTWRHNAMAIDMVEIMTSPHNTYTTELESLASSIQGEKVTLDSRTLLDIRV